MEYESLFPICVLRLELGNFCLFSSLDRLCMGKSLVFFQHDDD